MSLKLSRRGAIAAAVAAPGTLQVGDSAAITDSATAVPTFGLAQWYPTPPAVTKWVAPTAQGNGTGSSSGNAMSQSTMLTELGATASPGDVYGLRGDLGNYDTTGNRLINRSGSSGNPIVIRSADLANKAVVRYTGTATTPGGSYPYTWQVRGNNSYIDFYGMRLVGNAGGGAVTTWAGTGVSVGGGGNTTACHHVGVYGCDIEGMSAAGIGTSGTSAGGGGDYMRFVGNRVWRCGYNLHWSWASGIGLWYANWYDTYDGFHNYIIGNIIAAMWDAQGSGAQVGSVDGDPAYLSDGNGIIIDDMSNSTTGCPPTLIANNVVYGNGGCGIQHTRTRGVWTVNNTAVRNGLNDTSGYLSGAAGVNAAGASGDLPGYHRWVSNLVQNRTTETEDYCYGVSTANQTGTVLVDNAAYGAQIVYPSGWNTSGRINVTSDPLLTGPLPVANTATIDPFTDVPAPWTLDGDEFIPGAGSPVLGTATDPRTIAEATAPLIADMDDWVTRDIRGRTRSTSWDHGAYQVS